MKKLTDQAKQFITQELAMYSTPQEVVQMVKHYFGVELKRQHVFYYDASMNAELPEKWRDIFESTRNKFLGDVAEVPFSKKIIRLKRLSRYVEKFEDSGNFVKAAEMLEQIAKEVGGAYTNRREITGAEGRPIEMHQVTLDDWEKKADERRRQAAATLEMFQDDPIG